MNKSRHLKVETLETDEALSTEEKEALVGGLSTRFDPKLTGSAADGLRDIGHDVGGKRNVKRDVRQFGSTSKGGGTNV